MSNSPTFESEWKEYKKSKLKSINRNSQVTEEDIENLVNAMWEFKCLVQVHMEITESLEDIRKDVMALEE